MATITSFEELKCWQLSRKLVKDIYKLTDELPISKDYALKDQMRRAAISIMSNIAEGFGRSGNKEFIQFLSIAKGSITELHSQLYIALDCEYLNKEKFDTLTQKSTQATSAILKKCRTQRI